MLHIIFIQRRVNQRHQNDPTLEIFRETWKLPLFAVGSKTGEDNVCVITKLNSYTALSCSLSSKIVPILVDRLWNLSSKWSPFKTPCKNGYLKASQLRGRAQDTVLAITPDSRVPCARLPSNRDTIFNCAPKVSLTSFIMIFCTALCPYKHFTHIYVYMEIVWLKQVN